MKQVNKLSVLEKLTFGLLFVILFIFGLIESRDFLVPLLLGILLSYLLYPIAKFLETHKFPRVLANLISIILAIFILVIAGNFFSNQLSVFIQDLPEIREQATKNLENIREELSSAIGISTERFKNWEKDITTNLFEVSSKMESIFNTTTSTIVKIGLMPVFVFCFLYYRNKFYDFFIQILPSRHEEKIERVIGEVNLVVRKYMTGVFIVVLILSISHSIALTIIGIDHSVFFGVTAALFNFIPYFGTLIGAIIPLLYASLAMESPNYALWVLAYFAFIQFVDNNILTPNIIGGYVNLNPFIIILSLIFGSMVWGIAGMLLIVPIMAVLKIVCENMHDLKPVGFLLSDKGIEKHALTWKKVKSLFSK